jgi:hypothetical protein
MKIYDAFLSSKMNTILDLLLAFRMVFIYGLSEIKNKINQ